MGIEVTLTVFVVAWFGLAIFNSLVSQTLEPGYMGRMLDEGWLSTIFFLTFGILAFWPRIIMITLEWIGLLLGYCGWLSAVFAMSCFDRIKEEVFDVPLDLKRSLWLIPSITLGAIPATVIFSSMMAIGWVLLCFSDWTETLTGDREDAIY